MRKKRLTVRQVAELIGGTVEGDDTVQLDGVAAIDSAGGSDLTFATDEKHAARLAGSKAGAAIVSRSQPAAAIPLIRVDDVQAALAGLLEHLAEPEDLPPVGIHASAVVAPDAEIADGAAIGPGVVIGPRAKVGRSCALCANATVGADVELGEEVVLHESVVVKYGCKVGNRVRIGPNSVIGHDGFGYYTTGGVHHGIPHIGNVVIEDDVEIGACSCVDRAKFGSTRIGAGTKIDNLVQVAHNVQIGKGCLLAGQAGVAGSAKLGRYVVLGGHAGIRDNISLGNRVQCSAFAAVAADVPDGQIVAGMPAEPAKEKMRAVMAQKKLPELLKRVKKLETRLNALESPEDH